MQMKDNNPTIVEESKSGVTYTHILLKKKKQTVTKATFWKIPRSDPNNGFSLKIGRYKNDIWQTIDCENPKSELTLDQEELFGLMHFVNDRYNPLRKGAGKYIKAADSLNIELAKQLQDIFSSNDANEIGSFLVKNDILSVDTANMIEYCRREEALFDYEQALAEDRPEAYWQKWFEDNDWILGNEFARILDERNIDTKSIADYLVETFDGFVDIVEIKRPDGQLKFWSSNKDHNNLIPSQDLIKAITQTQNYIQSLEEEMNAAKTLKRLGNLSIVKPRATLIFGRSSDWGEEERRAFRILNAGYNNITILTYDQVLARARKTLNLAKNKKPSE